MQIRDVMSRSPARQFNALRAKPSAIRGWKQRRPRRGWARFAAWPGMLITFTLSSGVAAAPRRMEPAEASWTITYHEKDLHNPKGAGLVARKVRDAAEIVCSGDSLLVRSTPAFRRCRDGAIDRAVADLNAPLVTTALHRGGEVDAHR